MELKKYLKKCNMTQTYFAEKLGITRFYLSGIISGKRKAGKFLKEKIRRLTRGQVKIGEDK